MGLMWDVGECDGTQLHERRSCECGGLINLVYVTSLHKGLVK
jgi:hypothetical protein